MSKNKKENYLTAFIFCRNKTINEYIIVATRKFIVNDETYIIKDNCTYKKIVNKQIKLVAYYSEGNPNPYNLKSIEKNVGLTTEELDNITAGDIYNILIECQNTGKQKYIFHIVVFVLILSIFSLFMEIL
ncbi:MAG: hypothetical protein MUO82_10815 [Candidatus Thermoplasmatota archaeon]|nr:hypothetical protein [Candidatus Thermoplasmatota archaeon]